MKQTIKKLCLYWQAKKAENKAIKTIADSPMLKVVYKKDTSITLGCLTTGMSNSKPTLSWNSVELLVKNKTGDVRDFFKKVYKESKAKNISPQKYLDELAELTEKANLRRAAYNDFVNLVSRTNLNELVEHIFVGHLRISRVGRGANAARVPSSKGIHSEELLDGVVNRVKPGTRNPPNPIDDEIYKAEVQMQDNNGNWIDKVAFGNGRIIETTMFPKNWSKQRILEEVAFAFKNKTIPDLTKPHLFEGVATNGIKIRIIMRNNEIATVFPIY